MSQLLDQRHRQRGDALAAPGEAQAFGGGGFQVHRGRRDAEVRGAKSGS